MKLTFIRKTVLSGNTNCPSLYRTDRDTFIVQAGASRTPRRSASWRSRHTRRWSKFRWTFSRRC